MGEVKTLLITFIIVGGCIMGITTFVGGMANAMNYTGSVANYSYMSQMANTTEKINAMQTSLSSSTVESTDVITLVTSGAFEAAKMLPQTVDVGTSLITDIRQSLGLPAWVYSMFVGIIAVISVFAILYLIFKVNP